LLVIMTRDIPLYTSVNRIQGKYVLKNIDPDCEIGTSSYMG